MVDGNRQFQLAIVTAAGVAWHLDLAAPPGEALRPGKYFKPPLTGEVRLTSPELSPGLR